MSTPQIPIASATPHRAWRPPPGPYRVFISTPCDDGHRLCYHESLSDLELACARGRTRHQYRRHRTPGDSLIPRGRNNHAHHFYFHTADDWFLPIDSDLDFTVADIEQLLSDPWPIMAGRYAIKQPELRWCINEIPGIPIGQPSPDRQFVATAGTGLLAIHRHVIGTLIAGAVRWKRWQIPYQNDSDTGTTVHDLFFNGVVRDPRYFPAFPRGRYLSEDWGFCYLARRHGFPVVLDHRVTAFHEGSIKYPLGARRLGADEAAAGLAPSLHPTPAAS